MILEVKDLAKKYSKAANYTIEDININVKEGEIVGVVGHNGAGKSTTIKAICGMHPYDKGIIQICEYDLKKEPLKAPILN